MGLLKYTTENKRIEIDDTLKWYTNPEWTLKDVAELPLAYSMVKIRFRYLFLN